MHCINDLMTYFWYAELTEQADPKGISTAYQHGPWNLNYIILGYLHNQYWGQVVKVNDTVNHHDYVVNAFEKNL